MLENVPFVMWATTFVVLALSFIAFLAWYQSYSNAKSPIKKDHPNDPTSIRKLLRNGFSKKKIPAKLDCIVIGSGPGGLTTAALLAKKGWKVLVLEQHDRCGGGLHTYDNKGFEWETGFHYIGEVQDRQSPLNRIIANLTGDSIEWECLQNSKYNRTHYDEVWFGNESYRFPQGPKALAAELKKRFPNDVEAVDEFIRRCQNVSKLLVPFVIWRSIRPLWLKQLLKPCLAQKWLRESSKTTYDELRSFTQNPKLIAVLTYLWGCYAVPPKESAWGVSALISNHFMNGASYPRGGPGKIIAGMVRTINKHNGTVLVRAPVSEILTETTEGKTKACGVIVRGTTIYARTVVSSIGLHNTLHHLLPKSVDNVMRPLKAAVDSVKLTRGHVVLFVGLDGSTEDLKLPRCNYWLYPSGYDHDSSTERFSHDKELFLSASKKSSNRNRGSPNGDFTYIAMAFPSAKDPEYGQKNPGKSTAIAIMEVPTNWFPAVEGARPHHRGEEHNRLKARFGEKMLESMYTMFPQTKGKVSHFEIGTPCCNRFFLGKFAGDSYGIEPTPKFLKATLESFKPETPIQGLYISGQDVNMDGFAGAMLGGHSCAATMHGAFSMWIPILLQKIGIWNILFPPGDRSGI